MNDKPISSLDKHIPVYPEIEINHISKETSMSVPLVSAHTYLRYRSAGIWFLRKLSAMETIDEANPTMMDKMTAEHLVRNKVHHDVYVHMMWGVYSPNTTDVEGNPIDQKDLNQEDESKRLGL